MAIQWTGSDPTIGSCLLIDYTAIYKVKHRLHKLTAVPHLTSSLPVPPSRDINTGSCTTSVIKIFQSTHSFTLFRLLPSKVYNKYVDLLLAFLFTVVIQTRSYKNLQD